jgi:hypothetical protein
VSGGRAKMYLEIIYNVQHVNFGKIHSQNPGYGAGARVPRLMLGIRCKMLKFNVNGFVKRSITD